MKKQTYISIAAIALLAVGLWIFQEHAEALSGEIVSFIFAFSTSVVVGVLSYFKGKKREFGKNGAPTRFASKCP